MATVPVDQGILNRFGTDYVGRSGDEVVYLCPFCEENGKTPDTKGHLYVNNRSRLYVCFRCGAKGRVAPDMGDFEYGDPPITDQELYDLLAGPSETPKRYPIPRLLVSPDSDAGRYLSARGVTPAVVARYSIRQGEGRYRGRVVVPNEVFPAGDGGEETDMFVARYVYDIPRTPTGGDAFPKYLNPPDAGKSHIVFNLHRVPRGSPVIICEGVFSAISAGACAVAIYGKSMSKSQLSMVLSKSPSKVYVCLDPDARPEARELCRRLSRRTASPIYDVRLPEGHDPNSLGHAAFMRYLARSRRYDPVADALLGFS